MKVPSRAHSPRPNRNINIILSNYICCIDCRIGLSTINYLVILDIHRCKITGNAKHVFIIANWKRALDKVFFSRYPHLSFISLIHNPLILRSISFSRALYNLSHLYYPLYHFRDVCLCFQILFITKALFFKCFKYDLRNTKL